MKETKEPAYLEVEVKKIEYRYNPNYGNDRMCFCGHPYYRHFDTYEGMKNVGCKHCDCLVFAEMEVET